MLLPDIRSGRVIVIRVINNKAFRSAEGFISLFRLSIFLYLVPMAADELRGVKFFILGRIIILMAVPCGVPFMGGC